ncbi:Pkinase-domain-containing protein [Cadophora sp. DSE1049]|nr:Pkinase-domain-containing protein [Cadophora sp. DSE1049]
MENPRLSAIKDYPESNRNSQYSTTSNDSNAKIIKKCIGPWKLGKTLGQGATARVRFARHMYSGQEAAIKIVQKKNAQISQAGSLANLEEVESTQTDSGDGVKRMPLGIEREVAIMKLIQHPNIMKLYDIWENRTEIYLVLEFVDNGELFEHISKSGRLDEEEAVRYFRQMLSAIGYCHSFKICHRDLKPENILLTKQGEIKIADFGMAALQQAPDHRLKTSCGSPHYAAPELISGSEYRGDMIDIWSLGVVFYAMLAGRLPFDVEGSSQEALRPLLRKIKKGQYSMPAEFSEDAKSLVHRILQVNPKDRIRLQQIWKHPLLKKYDYLDNLSRGCYPQSPNVKNCDLTVIRKSDIHQDLLRNLRSMWHMYTEQQLIDALLSEKPNEPKLFYSLLLKYRDAALENYAPELAYSNSDYHHVRPVNLTKAYSTCHFPPAKGHGRQSSKFTVVSNGAETEQSYDPFKASRPQHLNAYRNGAAKITIHHPAESNAWEDEKPTTTPRKGSLASSGDRSRFQKLGPPPKIYASRSSMSSSLSRTSNGQVRARVGHKRGVSFSHSRKLSNITQRNASAPPFPSALHGRHSNHTEVTDDGGSVLRPVNETPASTRYIRSRKAQSVASQSYIAGPKSGRASQIWNEDVQQLSSSLAKDCDEAFNRISMISEADSEPTKRSNMEQTSIRANSNSKAKHSSFDTRPLPAPPARSDSVRYELLEARKQAELRKQFGNDESPSYLDRMVNHIDRLIQPLSPTQIMIDRRVTSAPSDTRYQPLNRALPSIYESRGEDSSPRRARERASFLEHQRKVEAKSGRIASAPEAWKFTHRQEDEYFKQASSGVKNTIRVVQPSSPLSPVRPPAPLTIRKKSSQGAPPPLMTGGLGIDEVASLNSHRPSGLDLRQQYKAASRHENSADLAPISETRNYGDQFESSSVTVVRKKSGWFKRNSKTEDDGSRLSIISTSSVPSKTMSNDTVQPPYERPQNPHLQSPRREPPKKKQFGFGRIFRKKSSKPDMSLSAHDVYEDGESVQDSIADARLKAFGVHDQSVDAKARQVAPQQSWLAKLFHVKPAFGFLCFTLSQRRTRREITFLLKDWKRYGIRDVQVNKERNIVFARVGAQNFLDMKEVSFAIEIMTVIEHGKKNHLSIARLTQEKGAASTFNHLLETLESVLKVKGVLVADERKKRMMIKTFNAAT